MAIDLNEAKIQRNEFGLWLGWTLATGAGMLVGFTSLLLFADFLGLGIYRVLTPLWAGMLVGVFQWLVLRQYMTYSVDWIFTGIAAWSLAFALGLLVVQILSGTFWGTLIAYVVFGIIIAVVQWPVLRREIPDVLPWVLANVAGWALGAYLSSLALDWVVNGPSVGQWLVSAVSSGVTGLIAGAVTGVVLVWIVRKPEQPLSTAG